jgi:2-amino-4-hydroxy-6-hydroxymethyldihydropteridine diphosphokinase
MPKPGREDLTRDTTIPIIIAIGSNLPDSDGRSPRLLCHAAVEALRGLPGLRLVSVSRTYQNPAWPPSDQPDYINAAALLDGTADPAWLLGQLHAIEARAGRTRSVANAARPLDLDIIDMGGLVRAAPDPILPHPRAHLRDFVLRPIADILPDWRHPVSGASVAALLAALSQDQCTAASRLAFPRHPT